VETFMKMAGFAHTDKREPPREPLEADAGPI